LNPNLSPAASGRLALLTSTVLAIVAVWLLVRMAWLLLAGPDVESAPVPAVPRAVQTSVAGNGSFDWDLFGRSRQAAAPTPVVAPASRSDLRLRGVMSQPRGGYAIIADGQGREEVYRVGDELPDGSHLESIEAQRVIIARNGRSESLEIDEARTSGRQTRATADSDSAPTQVAPLPGMRGFQAPTSISAASVQGLGDVGQLNPAAMADQISIMPVSSGGFRVRPGRDATLFTAVGLQINDVVTAINGQPIESEADARALFADIMRRGEVAITVNRQGREVTLRPDLDQIMRSMQSQ
jgi:general secretion pathway protein C